MDLIVFPTQALFLVSALFYGLTLSPWGQLIDPVAYLGDAQCAPLLLPEKLESTPRAIEVFLGDRLEHLLGELHMSVFVFVVRVSGWYILIIAIVSGGGLYLQQKHMQAISKQEQPT